MGHLFFANDKEMTQNSEHYPNPEKSLAVSKAIGAASAKQKAVPLSSIAERKVSFWLGVGVFWMPYIFAWLLLRPGHSKDARVLGFVWLTLYLLIILV
ncbi:hypothetical protein [uncultured Microbulbifer sp.]|uniref:hypothetical protein n=1 Tax=uncultured Microbulbifer sp. TaxID=348147 RepID=UPI0026293075|nr:hypothetical protein [uncultured Microbulbifer sp.]